jgi:hypothetical protein
LFKMDHFSQAPVAHTYNPSHLGGRDKEDHGSKPAQANSSCVYWELILLFSYIDVI